MQPHVRRTSSNSIPLASSCTPSTAKALPPLPPIETTSSQSTATSSTAYSPSIKRKPLPPKVLSPPPTSPPALPQRKPVPKHSITAVATNTLNQVLEREPAAQVFLPPLGLTYADTSRNTNIQSEPLNLLQSNHPSAKPLEPLDRVFLDQFPVPPSLGSPLPPTQPDEDSDPKMTQKGMGMGPGGKPPPLRMDSLKSLKALEVQKPASPRSKFTSFFSRKPVASPGGESNVTDISEGRSPIPSPYPPSESSNAGSVVNSYFTSNKPPSSQASQDSIEFRQPTPAVSRTPAKDRVAVLEAELKEISVELASSIRRELDLEELVDRLQSERPRQDPSNDRTSDYFSDSGTSSLRGTGSELTKDDVDKIKRESEQQRAQLKVDLSQKWQVEATQRRTLEAHLQILEDQLAQSRRTTNDASDSLSRAKELENALDDARRRLQEERRAKENFEDLVTALRVELEKQRSERDNLRDEVVPSLKTRLSGLEDNLADSEKSPYDVTVLQQEVQRLRDENTALRGTNNRGSMQFIAEEEDFVMSPRASTPALKVGGLQRSNTITGSRGNRASVTRSGSLSRSNSTLNRAQTIDTIESAVEKLKAAEQQRDALHNTVKYLLRRQEQQKKQFSKRTRMLQAEVDRSNASGPTPRKGGYEREVRVLRSEINTLRKRADDALDQKWQCEKNLAGLKMDLDRNKQETASLQKILQAKGSDPDVQGLISTTLENAIVELQKERERTRESASKIEQEEQLSFQLEQYAASSEALSGQVKRQLQANNALRARLKNAVEAGEANQQVSAEQINNLQIKLRKLEDSISAAQTQSETAVMKHEDELRVLKASHNAQLMRALSTSKKSPANLLTPTAKSPLSPMFANSKKSPRIDKTSSGPGMALHEALRTEYLENKVTDLEQALAETEAEISKIVGKMNQAQVNVADLEAERYEFSYHCTRHD